VIGRDGADEAGGGDAGTGPDEREAERFADLIGDAKPIERGPARVRPRSAPVGPRTPRDSGGARARDAFRWPDADEPGRAAAPGVSDAQLLALGRGEPAPEERIDLHGTRREAAARLVAQRIESASRRGLRCLIVIHGRGSGSGDRQAILRDALPGWLSKPPNAERVLAFAPAPRGLGGDGATLVLLRRSRRA